MKEKCNMFLVTREGQRVDIEYDIEADSYVNGFQNVGLYAADVQLKKGYIVTAQKTDYQQKEFQFVTEKYFNHYPTENELLYFMSSNGLSRFDIVSISEAFELDFGD